MFQVNAKPLVAAMTVTVCCISQARENLIEGTQELALQGFVDFDYVDDYLVSLNTSYGYFIRKNWEIGGVLDVNASGISKNFAFGGFTEYNFSNTSNWTPYVGIAAQVATLKSDDKEGTSLKGKDVTAMQFTGKLGVKYFINDHVALSFEVNHAMATDDINVSGDELKKSFTRLLVGTRFYY